MIRIKSRQPRSPSR